MRGSFLENEAYCSKEGELQESRERPEPGSRGDSKEIKELILSGEKTADDIAVDAPAFCHMYGRILDRLEAIALRKNGEIG
jgi:hypothetical protein